MKLADSHLELHHPAASMPLLVSVQCVPESEQEYAFNQFLQNIELDVPWMNIKSENSQPAIVCGAAPSLNQHIEEIRAKQSEGAVIYACNRAAQVLARQGVIPDYQVVLDPAEITESEFCEEASAHLLASICRPSLFARSKRPVLWHPMMERIVAHLDGKQREFAYIGGGITVTNSALCIAHTLGHRAISVYGMDSSYEDSFYADGETLQSVGSRQFIVDVEHNGKKYKTTIDMKQQVVVFVRIAAELARLGTKVEAMGSGLLQDVYNQTKEL